MLWHHLLPDTPWKASLPVKSSSSFLIQPRHHLVATSVPPWASFHPYGHRVNSSLLRVTRIPMHHILCPATLWPICLSSVFSLRPGAPSEQKPHHNPRTWSILGAHLILAWGKNECEIECLVYPLPKAEVPFIPSQPPWLTSGARQDINPPTKCNLTSLAGG